MIQALSMADLQSIFLKANCSRPAHSFLWRNQAGPNKANNPSRLVATPTVLIRTKKDLVLQFLYQPQAFLYCITTSLKSSDLHPALGKLGVPEGQTVDLQNKTSLQDLLACAASLAVWLG